MGFLLSLKGEIKMGKVNKLINNIKKNTAVILSLAVLCSTVLLPGVAFASEDGTSEIENILIEELSEENIEVESIEISAGEVVLEVSAEDADGEEVSAVVEFVPGEAYIYLVTLEYNSEGILEEREFIVDLNELEDYAGADGESIEFVIQDIETNEIFEYNSDEGELSGVITLLALKIGGAAIVGLLGLGLLKVVGGVLWLCLKKLKGNGNNNGGDNGNGNDFSINFSHFEVMISGNQIYLGAGMDLRAAATRLRNGGNVWSATAAEARAAANLATNRLPSLIQNNSTFGRRTNWYLDHIQPTPRTGGHSYFGTNLRRGWR